MKRVNRPQVIGFCSTVWQEVANRRLDGVLRYVDEHEGELAVRDFRYQEQIGDLEFGPAPPWKGLADGAIVCFGIAGNLDDVWNWLQRGEVPIVSLVSDWRHEQVPVVDTDSAALMKMAAQYLAREEYRQFVFVDNGLAPSETALHRRQFEKSLGDRRARNVVEYGLKFYPTGSAEDLDQVLRERELIEILKTAPKPLAVFGVNDNYARAVCWLCERMRLNVPGDVAILGSGNFVTSRCHVPTMSTVQTVNERVGYEAAQQLHRLMQRKTLETKTTLLAPQRVIERQSTNRTARHKDEVQAAYDYIREHAAEGINVDDVVRLLSISRRTFETRFVERIGQTPKQVIQQLRLERVLHLLAKTQISITQVAMMTGFCEVSALTNFLRKATGFSPSEFRKQAEQRVDH